MIAVLLKMMDQRVYENISIINFVLTLYFTYFCIVLTEI